MGWSSQCTPLEDRLTTQQDDHWQIRTHSEGGRVPAELTALYVHFKYLNYTAGLNYFLLMGYQFTD